MSTTFHSRKHDLVTNDSWDVGRLLRRCYNIGCDGICPNHQPENTHHRGKYHCTAELLFDWFVFDLSNLMLIQHKQSSWIHAKKQEVNCTVILLLTSCWFEIDLFTEHTNMMSFLIGSFRVSFPLFLSFQYRLLIQIVNKIADDCIQTADLWRQNHPLSQLHHTVLRTN